MACCNGCLKENISGFCPACETKLFDRSKAPSQLEFNGNDTQDRFMGQHTAFSISGVQPKGFIGRDRNNLLVPNRDIESMYIIKPFLDSRRILYHDSPANMFLLVDKSFLSDDGKLKYKEVVELNHRQLFNL